MSKDKGKEEIEALVETLKEALIRREAELSVAIVKENDAKSAVNRSFIERDRAEITYQRVLHLREIVLS